MNSRLLCAAMLLAVIFQAATSLAYPPPEKDDMIITELEQKIFDYIGKVVEVKASFATNIEQISADEYRVYLYGYAGGESIGGAAVYFSKNEDALEFFQKLLKKSYGSTATPFYILVEDKNKWIAIGKRFKKSKGTYTW